MRDYRTEQVRRRLAAVPVLFLGAAVTLALLVLSSCAGTPAVSEQKPMSEEISVDRPGALPVSFLSTAPIGGNPVFLGAAPRMTSAEEERTECLRSAAIQAARYLRLTGFAYLLKERAAGQTGYIHGVEVEDDVQLAAQLQARLDVVTQARTDEGLIMKFSVPDMAAPSVRPPARSGPGQPSWATLIPEIRDYFVGVGVARRSRLLTKSLDEADKAALVELLSQISVDLTSARLEYSMAGSGTYGRDSSVQVARGEMSGFYVLDRWVSEDGEYFYSLAVCPKTQAQ